MRKDSLSQRRAGTVVLVFALAACRNEPSPILGSGGAEDVGPPPLVVAVSREAGLSTNAAAATTPADRTRPLWFTSGPGVEAILAKERGDYPRARAELDRLLLATDLSPADRGAASLLRGLEAVRDREFERAAQWFEVARLSPGLSLIAVRVTAWEAQAWLDAGDPAKALALVEAEGTAADSPVRADLWLIQADAAARTGDPQRAIELYGAYLDGTPEGRRRFEAMAKLARTLQAQPDEAANLRAVDLYERLMLESPLSSYGEEALVAAPLLRARWGRSRHSQEARVFGRTVGLARVEALLEQQRFTATITEADNQLREVKVSVQDRCRLLYAKGSAQFKLRKRAESRPAFEQAASACRQAGAGFTGLEVKSRYQGARGRYAEGAYAKAAQRFEALATDHPDSSYADDAWVLAGESWAEAGESDKATKAYLRALTVNGDQRPEAYRRLLLPRLAAGDAPAALTLIDEALASPNPSVEFQAKLHYFRGRALRMLGREAEAETSFRDAIRVEPLGYMGLQALCRLRESGQAAFDKGLEILARTSEGEQEEMPTGNPAIERAMLLARLGLGEPAREELEFGQVRGWTAVEVLHRAGLFAEGQRIIANLGSAWRSQPPSEGNRARWQLAYPRPFSELVDGYESRHSVPEGLAFAVMQTESRFDPSVTSIAGARGLIQLMPGTAAWVAESNGRTVEPDALYVPATNLDIGMDYLARLVERFGGGDPAVPLAIPSYNAGVGNVDRWLKERGDWDYDLFVESIPFDETRRYTQTVLGRWWTYRWLYDQEAERERVPVVPLTLPSIDARRAAAGIP